MNNSTETVINLLIFIRSPFIPSSFSGKRRKNKSKLKINRQSLDRIFKATTGASALEIAGIELNSEMKLARRSLMTTGGDWGDWVLAPEFHYSWKNSLIDDYFNKDIDNNIEF